MTELITHLITENKPFIFVKFGDGEFYAAKGIYGRNCDNDPYTHKLKNGIIESIKYYSLLNNAYCAKWFNDEVHTFFDSIVPGRINWIKYTTCIMGRNSFSNNNKLNLFKAIKESKRNKLLIGNELLVKANYLLNIDKHIILPYSNWVENNFDNIYNSIVSHFNDDTNPFIITCGGMGSKILIMELHKKYPNGIFVDIGSGLDYLCTKRCSRGWAEDVSYDKLEKYFEEILPSNWNDSQFDYIYALAKNNIGLHLPK